MQVSQVVVFLALLTIGASLVGVSILLKDRLTVFLRHRLELGSRHEGSNTRLGRVYEKSPLSLIALVGLLFVVGFASLLVLACWFALSGLASVFSVLMVSAFTSVIAYQMVRDLHRLQVQEESIV